MASKKHSKSKKTAELGQLSTSPRWLSLLKTGQGCVCSVDIDIVRIGNHQQTSTIKVQVNSSSGSFKTTLLETRELTSPSRAAAEFQSLRKALEMCVDYMGR